MTRPSHDALEERLDLGETRFGEGAIEEAAAIFAEVTETDPQRARAWNDLGAARFALGDAEAAVQAFEQCLTIDPADVDALTNLVDVLTALGRVDDAAPHLATLESLDAASPASAGPVASLLALGGVLGDAGVCVLGDDALGEELARFGITLAPADQAETLILADATTPLPASSTSRRLIHIGADDPAAPEGWHAAGGFARHPEDGWLPAAYAGSRPLEIALFERGLAASAPRCRKATIFDWGRGQGASHGHLRRQLRALGWVVGEASRDVLEAVSASRNASLQLQPDLTAFIQRAAPSVILVDADSDEHGTIVGAAVTAGRPCLSIGEAAELGWPAAADESPVLLAAALDAVQPLDHVPPAMDAPGEMPALSIIAPTYDRHECVLQLLDTLAAQDLDTSLFEVIFVDDGSPQPVEEAVAGYSWPFRFVLDRQKNAGPGAARNTAIRQARAKWLLIFNDDAIPAADNLRRHLTGQARSEEPIAILGTFDMPDSARQQPFVDLMQVSHYLFDYKHMKPGALHDWRWFYTCNISVPRAQVEAVDGFDEGFPQAICEDIDLGYRLWDEEDVEILYDPRIRAIHDHDLDVHRFVRRSFMYGYWVHHLWEKHPKMKDFYLGRGTEPNEAYWLVHRASVDLDEPEVQRLVDEVAEIDATDTTELFSKERQAVLDRLEATVGKIGSHEFWRGQIAYENRWKEAALRRPPALENEKTSIIMPNLNGFPHVRVAIESLRRNTAGPYELIVVDNGSQDGSLEWLETQPDVHLIANDENVGAPAARNQALAVAEGETILFADNDVEFTPQWREILLGHLKAWPDVGLVGPMSHVVSGSQRTIDHKRHGEKVDAFAERFHAYHRGEHLYTHRLILYFLLVHRRVIDKIGGIDEGFGRWGFEDDDFSLRARIAGFQLRIARDCYVRHVGSQTARTAKIDYKQLLQENWEIFKQKWGLPDGLPIGTPVTAKDVVPATFNRAAHHVAIDQRERVRAALTS